MTPYEKFLSLKDKEQFLKPNITLESLALLAKQHTDLQAAELTQSARKNLFDAISKQENSLLH